ncbi:MAG: RDD family protein [Mycobacteriales bacterium]
MTVGGRVQQVVTGEAVSLDLRVATVPSRVLAGLLDALCQLALLLGIGGLATAVSTGASSAAGQALSIVVIVTVLIGYPVAFESLLRGRTPGKAALGLRVVRDDGGPIGFRQAFVRGLVGAFVERFGITLFFGALASMLLNDRSKRIGDLLAGTVVLQERVAVRGGAVAVMPAPLTGWAASLDLTGLPDGLALSVRQFLARERDLTPSAREDLGGRLVQAVLDVVTPAPPPGTPGWAVLPAVLAERRRRAEQGFAGRTPISAPVAARPIQAAASERPAPPAPSGGFAPPA